jgi:hypothetical protein
MTLGISPVVSSCGELFAAAILRLRVLSSLRNDAAPRITFYLRLSFAYRYNNARCFRCKIGNATAERKRNGMKKPALRVTKWLRDIPVEGCCNMCPDVVFRAETAHHRPEKAKYCELLQRAFDHHVANCHRADNTVVDLAP